MAMIGAEALSVLDGAGVTSSSIMTMCINTGLATICSHTATSS